jgi:hypothetical protein
MVTQIGDRLAASCHETTFWHSGRGCFQNPCGCPDFPIAMLFMAHFAVNLNCNQRLIRMSYSQGPPGTTCPDHQEARLHTHRKRRKTDRPCSLWEAEDF